MGRQSGGSRQARRAQARRQEQRSERGSGARSVTPARGTGIRRPAGGTNWSLIAGAVVVILAIAVFAFAVSGEAKRLGLGSSSATTAPATIPPGPSVAGIGCDDGMTGGTYYHIHAHISIINKGKPEAINPEYGHYYKKDCLFWMHAHPDVNGIIHMESPHQIHPTVATWYKIAQLTLGSAGDKVPQITPSPGEQERVWVNQKPYHGDPMKIKLSKHENITIEFGPPFVTPKPFTYPSGL